MYERSWHHLLPFLFLIDSHFYWLRWNLKAVLSCFSIMPNWQWNSTNICWLFVFFPLWTIFSVFFLAHMFLCSEKYLRTRTLGWWDDPVRKRCCHWACWPERSPWNLYSGGQSQRPQVVLWAPHVCHSTLMCALAHTNQQIAERKRKKAKNRRRTSVYINKEFLAYLIP